MLAGILPYTRCPRCGGSPLEGDGAEVRCRACRTGFPVRAGILDLLGEDCDEVITPFQRLMQTPLVVSIYEGIWRRIGYYIASSRSFSSEMNTVLAMNLGREAPRVLDLACGTGIFTRPLAAQSRGVVVGLDLSRPMLRQAEHLITRSGIKNTALIRASAFKLPFIDATFSYVNCCGALHLFDDPDPALAEIRRVLLPGGCLCVQTTLRPSRSRGLIYLLEHFIRFGFFEEAQLLEKLGRFGLRVLQSERHRISFTFLCQ